MGPAHVILVSDSHLSPAAPDALSNWEAALDAINAVAPDLVIHLGDLSLDGANDAGDLEFGRQQLDRLPAPWRVVPGNHDVGDNPRAGVADDDTIDAVRQQRWTDVIGADRWSADTGGWAVIGVNAQLFGSGLAAEDLQWSWIESQAQACGSGQQVALVMHKPLTGRPAELARSPERRFVPAPARRRLLRLFAGTRLALVLSGHVHQYRWLSLGDIDHLWVPTTWAVLPAELQPALGAKRCGVVSLTLSAGAPAEHQLVEPDGLAQQMLLRDLPDPYHRRRPTS
ncbi:MAG TPA: metallophosphoesterase [Streptosporangiaceae bacterium]